MESIVRRGPVPLKGARFRLPHGRRPKAARRDGTTTADNPFSGKSRCSAEGHRGGGMTLQIHRRPNSDKVFCAAQPQAGGRGPNREAGPAWAEEDSSPVTISSKKKADHRGSRSTRRRGARSSSKAAGPSCPGSWAKEGRHTGRQTRGVWNTTARAARWCSPSGRSGRKKAPTARPGAATIRGHPRAAVLRRTPIPRPQRPPRHQARLWEKGRALARRTSTMFEIKRRPVRVRWPVNTRSACSV